MADINSFFSINNTVKSLSEEDLRQTADYIQVIEAFARTSNQSIYVIDYEKKGFEFVSNNPLFLNGHTPQEVLEMGYDFYFKCVPEGDLNLLLQINEVGFQFYETIPEENRKMYSITYDFRLKTEAQKTILINQELTPLFLTEKGKIWKALCIVSLASNQESGNVIIRKNGHNETYRYDFKYNYWQTLDQIELSEREKEILRCSIQGYAINEIGDQLFISPDTVKFHRRKIYEKLEVGNISEAILKANNLLLL